MSDQRTPEGRLLRQATAVMDKTLAASAINRADLEVRASQDGSILGSATWARGNGWRFSAEVMANLKTRGGAYAHLRVTRSW